jgi:hypothetical protein
MRCGPPGVAFFGLVEINVCTWNNAPKLDRLLLLVLTNFPIPSSPNSIAG